jgi:stearoyl-CoA desaturase (delta-9 desaturase)
MMRVGVLDGGYQLAIDDMKRTEKAREAAAVASAQASKESTEDATPKGPQPPKDEFSTPIPAQDERGVDAKAKAYVPPGQVYTILKRGELKANSVAIKSGGKVGKFL